MTPTDFIIYSKCIYYLQNCVYLLHGSLNNQISFRRIFAVLWVEHCSTVPAVDGSHQAVQLPEANKPDVIAYLVVDCSLKEKYLDRKIG